MLLSGKEKNPVYTDQFLVENGAAEYSTIVMTPTGFLTDDSWRFIVPLLIKGIRKVVRDVAWTFGIDSKTADKLLVGLTFDGFKTHVKNLEELINMADSNIMALVEGRDSSEINQAFDKFVARAGKKRASITLDQLRRSHISPVIDQWMLVLVVLAMLRDCRDSQVWENSFVAVNMHPHHRVPFDDWLLKIAPFVQAAEKFENEVVDDFAMLPTEWRTKPLSLRKKWIQIIDDDGATWDVDLIDKLRKAGMTLSLIAKIYKIYQTEKRIAIKTSAPSTTPTTPEVATPPPSTPSKSSMRYHLFNANIAGMSPMQKFQHAIQVRNRSLGPVKGITVSPHLDVAMTEDNKRFLSLSPDDLNMHRVLQESTCRHGRRRKVARRTLNALGGVSGMAGFLNDPTQIKEIKQNLKFAMSLEAIKSAEKECKRVKAKKLRDKHYNSARKKVELGPAGTFYKHHAKKLTIPQMKAVALVEFNAVLVGKAAPVREALVELLPADNDDDLVDLPEIDEVPQVPQYATQDELFYVDVALEDMEVGENVEVYWKGDNIWYEGKIVAVDLAQKQFEVYYFLDEKNWLHNTEDYKVRVSTC